MKKLLWGLLIMAMGMLDSGTAACAEMTISAAASLTNAFGELAKEFEKRHPGLTVHANYAASNPLLKQMQEGAPVDVFATADLETMDKAEGGKLIDPATRVNFAKNDLVLIIPKGKSKPENLAALAKLPHVVIGNPDSVPAGRYARAAMENAGVWGDLKDNLILATSVRQALDYIARGEADAGFVYATDARQMGDKVEIVEVVTGHEPVYYPAAVSVTGQNPQAGAEFINFVMSPDGQAVLAKYGFAKP